MSIVAIAMFSRRFRAPVARRHAGGELERGPAGDGAPPMGGEGREHGVEQRHSAASAAATSTVRRRTRAAARTSDSPERGRGSVRSAEADAR